MGRNIISIAVDAAVDGAEAAVRRVGDTLEDAGRRAADAGEHMDEARDRMGRTAEGADELASKGAQAAGAMSGLGDLVGGKLGNAMVAGGVGMQAFADAGDLVNAALENSIVTKIKDRAATIAHTATTKAAELATKGQAVAQKALNLVMRASPILLAVAALAALAAGLIYAYKHSATFRAIVQGAFAVVKRVAQDVANFFTRQVPAAFDKVTGAASRVIGWVRSHWPLLVAILTGPIGLAVLGITRNWDKITSGVRGVYDKIRSWFGKAVDYIRGIPGTIGRVFSGLWSGIADGLRSALNSVLGLPLTIPRINTHIPGVGTVGGEVLIPALANGGIVTGPTLALIGEAGPEAVVPLDRGFGGITVNVQVSPFANPAEVGREVVAAIAAFLAGGGRLPAAVGG